MEISRQEMSIDPVYVEKAMSYTDYIQMVESLLAENKATGHPHPEIYLHFTKMNLQRMHRLEKTLELIPAVKATILAIDRPQIWLVLTEGWCGDAAQSMPVMQVFSKLNPLVELKILLRDEHPALMDQYLTNGVSRSIPKLIAADKKNLQELFTWGPRPQVLQETFYRLKAEGLHHDAIKEQLQRWYNADKTTAIQEEIATLVAASQGPA